jgi:hypothetical protein
MGDHDCEGREDVMANIRESREETCSEARLELDREALRVLAST